MRKNKKNKKSALRIKLASVLKWITTHKRISLFGMLAFIFLLAASLFLIRTRLPIAPQVSSAKASVSHSLHVALNQKIGDIDTTKISISPSVAGSWKYEASALLGNDRLVFTPKTYFTVATDYTVTFPAAKRTLFGEAKLPNVSFQTESAPSVTSESLKSFTPGAAVPADYTFSVTLGSPNRQLRSLVLRTTPNIPLTPKVQNDTTYSWRSSELLPQGQKISVELYDEKNQVSLIKKDITIASEPRITSPAARDRLQSKDPIAITFDQPITPGEQTDITFDTPGNGTWKSPTEYVFSPNGLSAGKTYSYVIKKGLRSTTGGIVTSDQSGTLSTMGAVAVTASGPRGKNLSQAKQTVSFTFDQSVNHESAQSRVSLSSGTISGFSWQGNTLNVTVVNLGYQRTVTASVAAGVVNTGFGLPSSQVFSTSFTTETRSARLTVPYYRQQHSATCTAAALRMVLGHRNVSSDEMGLVNAMGYAPRNKDTSTNPATWDDPDQMFVGSIDGSIAKGTGAGPDAAPIAKAARAYGRSAQDFTGISAGWIAGQVYAGNPVIMFGAFRATGMTSWQTPTGKNVTMNLTGHVTVVTGVVGEPSNPIGFYVHDSLNGGNQYWSTGTVAANIARDPYRQAVVVY
ncbi:hypothetical protein A2707_03215 [Candidatus Saccharibacteria bacterium RIFCSPHIGHO2_01_FULL_45_15]|nr:MAG: hypothetical protein A2707_03215 [Candidatus Saccharibacteria bacterium RIFCSPHIGHO2_01_FULL_45_15]OGL28452.1 MAG: hypothetical protein A3C39_02845 [Candidatus Saccharibacteria bacterium RIFCSPHIGHO2_02_FULL_46_12]OGL32489.1 MAG: hypothetical protein A3E76_00355 [Candidatus Saccharibacteria bacterium RIFCSPHIGHO2_12_FULL_44_22]